MVKKEKSALAMIPFFPLTILYFEILLKILLHTPITPRAFFLMLIFSVAAGMVFWLLSTVWPGYLANRIVGFALLFLTTLVFVMELLIHRNAFAYMDLSFIFRNADNAVGDFGDLVLGAIGFGIGSILLYIIPLVIYTFLQLKLFTFTRPSWTFFVTAAIAVAILHVSALGIIYISKNGVIPDKGYYTSEFNINQAVPRFGLLTSLRLDLKFSLFGLPEYGGEPESPDIPDIPTMPAATPTDSVPVFNTDNPNTPTPSPSPIVYKPNMLDIDFAALSEDTADAKLQEMHKYFASVSPTLKNEYTGMFKGKNLIQITAESLSPFMITPELTPTLYMMMNSGFSFTDYYHPFWGNSTTTGEYAHLLGLYPQDGQAMQKSPDQYLPYTIGNGLLNSGEAYTSLAYHNYDASYYERDRTHEHLGYTKFSAFGRGLKLLDGGRRESDLDMFKATVDDYIDFSPFNVYYMTYSGHLPYNPGSARGIVNSFCKKNWDLVKDLPYSDVVKGYISVNLEFELAMRYLIERLDEAGILNDTVISITPDHYPYGLNKGWNGNEADYLFELSGSPDAFDREFEQYKSMWILWSGDMEKHVVSSPTYALDILPTLSNLFGIDYDSRLMIGRDALSNSPALVIFPTMSWITDYGRFDATTGTFTVSPNASSVFDYDEYAEAVSSAVRSKVAYSKDIQKKDYYRVLFG